ncbi:MAG: O-antigen ligase family protein [Anaerolineaceae bacterium]|nr:O-antigen ligase family protein [Anaerolineaceae bacterium]
MFEIANDRWFPVVNSVIAGGAAALWYLSSGKIGWPLLVAVLVPWIMHIAAGRFPFRRTRFDGWLLLFAATAVIGTFTAYDPEVAQGKLWVLIGAMALYFAVVSVSRQDVWLLAGGAGPVGTLLAIYFALSNDWQLWPSEIGMFNRLGTMWARLRPSFGLPVLHPNTLAGMMALLLPLMVAFGLFAWRKRNMHWLRLAIVTGLITAGGLFFTSSLGAWLALAVGFGLWLLWEASGRLQRKTPFSHTTIFATAVLVIVAVGPLLVFLAARAGLGQADASGRLFLARQTLFLIQDFALTGSGLATFPALYAQYIQVTPVFFAAYSNFFLDIWLEQGLVALVAMVVLISGCFWLLGRSGLSSAQSRRWRGEMMNSEDLILFRWGAFASLMVMALHGLIDNALYGSQGSPLLFFAPAMVVLVTRQSELETAVPVTRRLSRLGIGLGVTSVLLMGLFFGFRQQIEAQWYANLGALAQARVELVGWPTGKWDNGQNLERFAAAADLFEQALVLNPDNQTAHHRLGAIAMVAREYETAVWHLEQAEGQANSHRGVIKSLGYSYAWQGQYEQAAHYLTNLRETRAEMAIYVGWWRQQNRLDFAARAGEMVAILENKVLLNP